MPYIYILHFDQAFSHARHYIGCTEHLRARLTAHANGAGANLLRHLNLNGLSWRLGGLYTCTKTQMRRMERHFKDKRDSEGYCQLCHPANQRRVPGLQLENIHNLPFPGTSTDLQSNHVDIAEVRIVTRDDLDAANKFIIHLMNKDKDCLGFVPVGGKYGINWLVDKGQVLLAYENGEPCGYSFYTLGHQKDADYNHVSIHQVCIADDVRLKGHATALVETINAAHREKLIVAKVRDDLAANLFWQHIGFTVHHTKTHKTSGSTIHHYHRLKEKEQ